MTEETTPAMLPVKKIVDDMSGRVSDVDASQILNKFITLSADLRELGLRTNIKKAESLSLLDAYAVRLRQVGFKECADIVDIRLLFYRINKCSEGGWMTDKVVEALKAIYPMYSGMEEEQDIGRKSRFLGFGGHR